MIDIQLIGAPAFALRVLLDGSFRYMGINAAHERVTGLRNADIAGRTPEEAFGPEIGARLGGNYAECVRRCGLFEYEEHVPLPSGATDWRTSLTPIFDSAGGRVEIVLGVAVDITAQKRAEEQLKKAHAQLALAFEATGGAFWYFDVPEKRYTTSASMGLLAGEAKPRSLTADEFLALLPPEDRPLATFDALLAGEVDSEIKEYRFRLPDGGTKWIRCRRKAIRGADGQVAALTGVTMDISEERARELELSRSAMQDPLTGIANRRAFSEQLQRMVARGQREDRPFAVFLVDLDDFKDINDRHGHAAGDAVLAEVASRLTASLRPYDVAARLGGDEFAVLADGLDATSIEPLRQRLAAALNRPLAETEGANPGGTIPIGASIGAAAFDAALDGPALLAAADADLYHVKRQRHAGARRLHAVR